MKETPEEREERIRKDVFNPKESDAAYALRRGVELGVAKTVTLSEAIERDLRKVLSDSPAITSPECLKHSIMKSRFVEHFTEEVLKLNSQHYNEEGAKRLVIENFDAAVDRIYAR